MSLYTCNVCGGKPKSRQAYEKHLKSNKHLKNSKLKCKYCECLFDCGETLKQHESNHIEEYNDCESKIKKHVCGYCNKKYVSKSLLLVHIEKHLEELDKIKVEGLSMKEKEEYFGKGKAWVLRNISVYKKRGDVFYIKL